jgi:hypothetical protein
VFEDPDQVRFNLFEGGRVYFEFDGQPIDYTEFIDQEELFENSSQAKYYWNRANGQQSRRRITNCFVPGERGYDLPRSYIDGGIILTKGVTITRREFEDLSRREWQELEILVSKIPNIVVEELGDIRVLWIYDKIPVITSMTNE